MTRQQCSIVAAVLHVNQDLKFLHAKPRCRYGRTLYLDILKGHLFGKLSWCCVKHRVYILWVLPCYQDRDVVEDSARSREEKKKIKKEKAERKESIKDKVYPFLSQVLFLHWKLLLFNCKSYWMVLSQMGICLIMNKGVSSSNPFISSGLSSELTLTSIIVHMLSIVRHHIAQHIPRLWQN